MSGTDLESSWPSDDVPLMIRAADGTERLVAHELSDLGFHWERSGRGGLLTTASWEGALRIALWSQVGTRVLVELGSGPAWDQAELYRTVSRVPWEAWLGRSSTFAIDASGGNETLRTRVFVAQKAKDAIADRLQRKWGSRPDVDRYDPDLLVVVHVDGDHVWLGLDLVGHSLHRRGYRAEAGVAPLRETLGAAMVFASHWDLRQAFVDPMCGSGTIAIEAAMLAHRVAPGLRLRPAACRWAPVGQHVRQAWSRLVEQAHGLRVPPNEAPPIFASDRDPHMVDLARENARRAQVADVIQFHTAPVSTCPVPPGPSVWVTNPPFGERLADEQLAMMALKELAQRQRKLPGVALVLLPTANLEMARTAGIEGKVVAKLKNGPIPCVLLRIELVSET